MAKNGGWDTKAEPIRKGERVALLISKCACGVQYFATDGEGVVLEGPQFDDSELYVEMDDGRFLYLFPWQVVRPSEAAAEIKLRHQQK